MIIKTESNKTILEIKINDNIERYHCDFSVCQNPVCRCGSMEITLSPLAANNQINTELEPKIVDIDIYERTLINNKKDNESKVDIEFAEYVLNSLTEDDYSMLQAAQFQFKNKITEETSPANIKTVFNYEEIEQNGEMCSYNDVLPHGDRLMLTLDGTEYQMLDQYCVKPNCSCTEVYLSFACEGDNKIDPFRDIATSYVKKQWTPLESDYSFIEKGTLKSTAEAQIPNLYILLKKRHSKLKTIYANNRKDSYEPVIASVEDKVGRNDPCPCGSGKKYKKCCLNK